MFTSILFSEPRIFDKYESQRPFLLMTTLQNKKINKESNPIAEINKYLLNKKYIKNIQAAELGNLYQQLFQLKIIFLNESSS